VKLVFVIFFFFFSSRRRHTRSKRDWSSDVCSSDLFMYGVITGQQFIETGVYNHVLVIGVDKLSKITDWTDRNTCVLLGDGPGAAILGKVSDNRGILSFELGSDGSG